MLTPVCDLLPCITPPPQGCSHPSHRARVRYVNGPSLLQLAVADFEPGNHQQSLLRRLAVPRVVNHIEKARGNMPLASHHNCEGPLETPL